MTLWFVCVHLNSCWRRWLRPVRTAVRSADDVRRALRRCRLHVPIPAALWYVIQLLIAHVCIGSGVLNSLCLSTGYQPQVAGPGPPIQTTESGQGTILITICIPGWLVVCRQSHYLGAYCILICVAIVHRTLVFRAALAYCCICLQDLLAAISLCSIFPTI